MIAKPTVAIYGIKDRNNLENPAYTHDHNLCIMQNGKIIQYLQLERYTRRKYDNKLDEYLEELIEKKLISLPDEFDLVSVNSFLGNSFITKNGKIRLDSLPQKELSNDLEEAFAFYQFSDWEGKEVKAYNCSQELAHIATCLPFFGNFKENSLLIHFDGASSVSNFSAFLFKNSKLELIEYNWDLKFIANFFNDNAFTFAILNARPGDHCSVPGKLMGYASLGEYDEKIEKWLTKNNYFKEYWNKTDEILFSIQKEFNIEISSFDNSSSFFQNVAATFQRIFENEVLKKINHLKQNHKADYLYYSGGCALNIVANTRIINECNFREVFIPPCCNDSGLSIGAAAFLEWKKGNNIQIHTPYLNNVSVNNNISNVSNEDIIRTANIILEGGIVGVCNFNGEIGPRALGNRSLIALANDKEIAKKVSMLIKKREWYRPVAPIMLSKNVNQVSKSQYHHLSKFMLLDFKIKKEYYNDLEGVIHFNNTARIQALNDETENPFMYKLLNYLYDNHGILALINTSFNIQGEPIVQTAKEAFDSATKMNLDALVVNNKFQKI